MYCKDWVNLDVTPVDNCVLHHDISRGLPFSDNSVKFIYISQVIEHLTRPIAMSLLRDCSRVMMSGGLIRICVPDGEAIAREYLKQLEAAMNGGKVQQRRYEWICIEMLDQLVRDKCSGEMIQFIREIDPSSDEGKYIHLRAGRLAERVWSKAQQPVNENRIDNNRLRIYGIVNMIQKLREQLISWILGREYAALVVGRFAVSGELHRWVYDYYSLSRLLDTCGFTGMVRMFPGQSNIIPKNTRFGTQELDLETVETHAAHLIIECHKR